MADPIDALALERDPAVIFVLDREWRLRLCNAAWDRFARENGGGQLARSHVVGRNIFDFISGDVADHYRRLFQKTIESGIVGRQEYECSSPLVLRRFAMHIYPVNGELLVVHSLLVETAHERDPIPAVEANYRNADGFMVMCSNCRRVKANSAEGRWDWAPGFVASPPMIVTHGLCGPCYEYYCSML